eukprot:Rhum_TRINITY_DN14515_c1_g3::Rhum_TRINITY_DN14515_c1_g3_i1::g.94402::m.94402
MSTRSVTPPRGYGGGSSSGGGGAYVYEREEPSQPPQPRESGRIRGAAIAPRYTSMRLSTAEADESEMSGELWVVSGNFGVRKKKAWVTVNYQTRRLSIYSSFSRDHSKLLDDVDFKLIVKLFWFTHDCVCPDDDRRGSHARRSSLTSASASAPTQRHWYFGLELVKEPGGIDRHHGDQSSATTRATMKDKRSEVVIFCTDAKEVYKKWEAFLSTEAAADGGLVKTTRGDVLRHEGEDAARALEEKRRMEDRVEDLIRSHEFQMSLKDASMQERVQELEERYAAQLNDVVVREEHERQVGTLLEQKRELQERERQFQEGLRLAQESVRQVTSDNTQLEARVGGYEAELKTLRDLLAKAQRRSGSREPTPESQAVTRALEVKLEELTLVVEGLESDNRQLVTSLGHADDEITQRDEQLALVGDAVATATAEIQALRRYRAELQDLYEYLTASFNAEGNQPIPSFEEGGVTEMVRALAEQVGEAGGAAASSDLAARLAAVVHAFDPAVMQEAQRKAGADVIAAAGAGAGAGA